MNQSFFILNRQKLRQAVQADIFVIAAHGVLQQSADMGFPFRQDSYFWYLCGLMIPEALLVIDVNAGEEWVIMPNQTGYAKIFEGEHDYAAAVKQSGVEQLLSQEKGWKKLKKRLREVKKVGLLAPHEHYIETYALYANPAREALYRKLRKSYSIIDWIDIRPDLAKMRMVKEPEEIALIEQAIAITANGLKKLHNEAYTHEYEIEARLSYEFRRSGAHGHGYDPIVAAGKNACTLHYNENNGQLGEGQPLLIDVGAYYQNYSADITRMFVCGQPSARVVEVHEALKNAHQRSLSLVRPGIYLRDILAQAEIVVGEALIELGLIREITRESVREYFPHSLSHFLGIDVHDAGDYDQPLTPGVVMTVEPGIYIQAEGIGMRLEDDVLVTETGYRNLSQAIPLDLISLKQAA